MTDSDHVGRSDRPSLWLSPADTRALSLATRVALLVGGYVGQRNVGDVAQAMTAVSLAREAGYAPFLVCEASLERSHRDGPLPGGLGEVPVAWLVRPEDEPPAEAVSAPAISGGGPIVVHLYGGGFLTDRWRVPMCQMLDAVWAWAERAADGQAGLVVSGQQLDDGALTDPTVRRLLARASVALARDPDSAVLLGELAGVPARFGGDDAVLALADVAAGGEVRSLLVHVNALDHVTADGAAWIAAVADIVRTWLARLDADVRVRPVTAFRSAVPGRLVVDEAADQRRLVDLLGAEFVRRTDDPVDLVGALTAGRGPAPVGVIASSYHAALQGALLGAPVLLLVENDYYRRKGRGLVALLPTGTAAVLDVGSGWTDARREEVARVIDDLRPMTRDERVALLSRHRIAADITVAGYRLLAAEADRRAAGDFREAYVRLVADRGAMQRSLHRALNDAERAAERAAEDRRRRVEAEAARAAAAADVAAAHAESDGLRAELEHTRRDLDTVRSTKLLRWSAGPRRAYSRLRRPTGAPD